MSGLFAWCSLAVFDSNDDASEIDENFAYWAEWVDAV
jgi:hypothetical protein